MKKIPFALLCALFSSFLYAASFPSVQHWQTKDGMAVYFVPETTLPMVDILMGFHAGSIYDGDHFGLSYLTAQIIGTGYKRMGETEIARKFDDHGAQFSVSSNREMSVIHLRSLSDPKHLVPVATFLNQLLTEPDFRIQILLRKKRQMSAALAEQKEQLDEITLAKFYNALYGKTPYAHDPLGNTAALPRLSEPEVNAFYHRYYVSQNGVLVIVGHLTETEAKTLSETVTQHFPVGKPAPSVTPIVTPKTRTLTMHQPAAQTHVVIGTLGVRYTDKDWLPLYLGNLILGGTTSSRLFKTIREKHGWVYGINSYPIAASAPGPFIIQFATKQPDAAIAEVNKQLKDYLATGPTDSELQTAKNTLIGSFPLQLDSNAKIASRLLRNRFYHLPLSRLQSLPEQVQAITRQQILNALKTTLARRQWITVRYGA